MSKYSIGPTDSLLSQIPKIVTIHDSIPASWTVSLLRHTSLIYRNWKRAGADAATSQSTFFLLYFGVSLTEKLANISLPPVTGNASIPQDPSQFHLLLASNLFEEIHLSLTEAGIPEVSPMGQSYDVAERVNIAVSELRDSKNFIKLRA